MTDTAWLKPTDLATCFDLFELSAFRYEAGDTAVADETPRVEAFRNHRPIPERSLRTSPWLRRIADTTDSGMHWSRIRRVHQPLSVYSLFQLTTAYVESEQAREVIRIADATTHPQLEVLNRHFWLFDEETGHPFAALMNYDKQGEYLGAEVTTKPEIIQRLLSQKQLLEHFAVPHTEYLSHLRHAA